MNDYIFVPSDNTYNACYVVQSEGVIRGYDRIPSYNTNYHYRDYYINSSYIFRDGSGTWSNYANLPVCLSSDIITNDFYYRLDFPNILLMFFIINIFGIYLPIKIFMKILPRRFK